MKIYFLIVFVLFAVVQAESQCGKKKSEKPKEDKTMTKNIDDIQYKDLPDDAKLTDEVRVNELNEKGEVIGYTTVTVEQKLREIGAKYLDGKLVDKNGREIRFFKPLVRGMSEGFEKDEEFRQSEEKRLNDLKEKFTVIEIFVNPLKVL